MIPFTFDTIEMNTGLYDGGDAVWYVQETDFFDMPDFRQSVIDRSIDHGSVMARSMLGRRIIRFSGVCKAIGGAVNVWAARDRLYAALATFTSTKTLVVDEYGTRKQMAYWGTSSPSIKIFPGGFEFDFQVLCEDPRKYAVQRSYGNANASSGTSLTIRTQGSFAAQPSIRVTGLPSAAATNTITITNTVGGSVISSFSIPAFTTASGESSVTIDTSTRTVITSLGTNRMSNVSTTLNQWPELQAGVPNVVSFTGSGYSMNVSYRDTWL